MAEKLTLKKILEKGIQKEIESQRLYTDLSQKVKEQSAKDAFMNLFQEEQKHQNFLERYLNGEIKVGVLRITDVIDYKIAEHLYQPEVTPVMKLEDIFLLAANREKTSHEFYLGLAGVHPQGETRQLIEGLAAQELKHKQKVEFLYTEVAFPQTDGG